MYFKLLEDCASTAAAAQSMSKQKSLQAKPESNSPTQIIVKGKCGEKASTFFVDTGSSVSLISKAFTDTHGFTGQALKSNLSLKSFTADSIKTYGVLNLPVTIAECSVNQAFVITDLVDTTCLLGMNFLTANHINVDIINQRLTSASGSSPFLKKPSQLLNHSTVKSSAHYSVPPNTVMFITAYTKDYSNSTGTGFLEPKMSLLESGLLITSGLCLTESKKVPVRLINFSDSPVQVYKHKVLGKLHPVNSTCDENYRSVTTFESPAAEVNTVHTTEPDSEITDNGWTQERLWSELRIDEISTVTETERDRLKTLVWNYRKCFSTGPSDLGECTMYEADIQLKPNYKPAWVPARPIPYKLQGEFQKQMNDLKTAGVIEECKEKSLFNSPVFLVRKPQSGRKPNSPEKFRFVVDMRAVNIECLPDSFQMPLIGHVVDKIGGCKLYSTFDFSQSFHQIRYNEKSRPITAFTACGTRYWFKRMIMGHKNSGAQFSRCMSKMMANLPFEQLIFFLDDLLLGSDTVQSHVERLKHVFSRLHAASMKLSPAKCHFLQRRVNYVGITIDESGLTINQERVQALVELKAPHNRKGLQSLLGFFGFNRKWIKNYAGLTKCMYSLLRKDVPFKWTAQCEDNLTKLKEAAKNHISLAIPDLKDELQSYQLVIDGSQDGMGAHLSQIIRGERRIIGYYSKAVPNHKKEWGQTKLEFLTMYHAIENWKAYLKGTLFVCKTDCESLLNIETIFSKGNPALRRKIQTLAEYDFRIEHISGESNYVADFLSRYPFKKKFKDAGTQCSLSNGPTSYFSAKIQSSTSSSKPKEIIAGMVQRVTRICKIQNDKLVNIPGKKRDSGRNATNYPVLDKRYQTKPGTVSQDKSPRKDGTTVTTGNKVSLEIKVSSGNKVHPVEEASTGDKVLQTCEVLPGNKVSPPNKIPVNTKVPTENEVSELGNKASTIKNESSEIEVPTTSEVPMVNEVPTSEKVSKANEVPTSNKFLTINDVLQEKETHLRKEVPRKNEVLPHQNHLESTSPEEELLIPKGFFNPKRSLPSIGSSHITHQGAKETESEQVYCICPPSVIKVCAVTEPTATDENAIITQPSITELSSMLNEIKKVQELDPILSSVKRWLIAEKKPDALQAHRVPKELLSYWKQFELLHLKDEIIMRKWIAINKGNKELDRDLVCVPETMQEEVLKMCHSSLSVNHPGINATLDICRKFYYWPGMSLDVELYTKACITCGMCKPAQSFMKVKRQHVVANKFNDILVIDHIEPEKLGLSANRFKYILSLTDVWSGYVTAVSTKTQTAEETISLIMHRWVLQNGVPRDVIADNAPGFRAKFYQAVLDTFDCNFTYGLPYECKSTAKAERTNKRLNQSLRLILADKDPKTWDKYIDYVCSALNSIKNRNTGYTANFLKFGHELNTPVSLLLTNGDISDVVANVDQNPYNKVAYEMHRKYKEIIANVSKHLKATYERDDMPHNKRLDKPFKSGDYCFVMVRCPVHKFSPRWHGPVKILKVISDCVYVIQLQNREKVVNISKLKRYSVNKFSPNQLSPNATSFTPSQDPQSKLPVDFSSADDPTRQTVSLDTTKAPSQPHISSDNELMADISFPETRVSSRQKKQTENLQVIPKARSY